MFYGLLADRLCISPNDVEEMFLDLAENQIEYWAEQAGNSAPPKSARDLARQFGGKVVKRG